MINLKLFIITSIVVNAIPGVDRIIVLTISIKSGARSGIFASLGVAVATFMHALVVSFSLYYLFKTSDTPFYYVQRAGLCFLIGLGIYLVIRSFRDGVRLLTTDRSK